MPEPTPRRAGRAEDDQPTTWEVLRRIDSLETSLGRRLDHFEESLGDLDERYHRRELLDARHLDHERRLTALEQVRSARTTALIALGAGNVASLLGALVLVVVRH